MKKTIRRSFGLVVILGLLFTHFYLPRFVTEIKNPLIMKIKSNYAAPSAIRYENHVTSGKHIKVNAYDGAVLVGYLTYATTPEPKGTIIFLHGIRSRKEQFIDMCKKLADLGYNTVAMDSRGHGDSGGQHCTFGVRERKDISALIDQLRKEGIDTKIGIWGQSLGGAIGLQAMGTDDRISFGIIESTFSDFSAVTKDYFQYHAGFNIDFFTEYLIRRAGSIADFDPKDAQPVKYCKNINQPILIVHGNNDRRINIRYGRENYQAIPSKQKSFIEIPNAGHLDVWKVGGSDYYERVIDFITKHSE